MKEIEVLILEDDPMDLELLLSSLNKGFKTHIASNEEEAVALFKLNSIDIAILDIYINGEPKGLEFADFIHNSGTKKCPVIFLTSSLDRSIFEKAKKSYPNNFLIKPFNSLELLYSMELAISNTLEDAQNYNWDGSNGAVMMNQHFLIKKRNSWVKVSPSEIILIEVEGRYCKLVTDQGSFLIQSSLVRLLENLNQSIFIQSHRNYAINSERVKELIPSDNLIIMDNDQTVFLSGRLKENFLKQFQLLK